MRLQKPIFPKGGSMSWEQKLSHLDQNRRLAARSAKQYWKESSYMADNELLDIRHPRATSSEMISGLLFIKMERLFRFPSALVVWGEEFFKKRW